MTKTRLEVIGRRQFVLAAGAAGLAGFLTSLSRPAHALSVDESIMKLVGDAKPEQSGAITIKVPEIAENGNTVPISVSVESPMTKDDYVKSVHLFADGNPLPDVATLHFTPMSGAARSSTRIRLAKTQNIIALAETSTGKVLINKAQIKVTIGGCGG